MNLSISSRTVMPYKSMTYDACVSKCVSKPLFLTSIRKNGTPVAAATGAYKSIHTELIK